MTSTTGQLITAEETDSRAANFAVNQNLSKVCYQHNHANTLNQISIFKYTEVAKEFLQTVILTA